MAADELHGRIGHPAQAHLRKGAECPDIASHGDLEAAFDLRLDKTFNGDAAAPGLLKVIGVRTGTDPGGEDTFPGPALEEIHLDRIPDPFGQFSVLAYIKKYRFSAYADNGGADFLPWGQAAHFFRVFLPEEIFKALTHGSHRCILSVAEYSLGKMPFNYESGFKGKTCQESIPEANIL